LGRPQRFSRGSANGWNRRNLAIAADNREKPNFGRKRAFENPPSKVPLLWLPDHNRRTDFVLFVPGQRDALIFDRIRYPVRAPHRLHLTQRMTSFLPSEARSASVKAWLMPIGVAP
jgi:hypothetical protein